MLNPVSYSLRHFILFILMSAPFWCIQPAEASLLNFLSAPQPRICGLKSGETLITETDSLIEAVSPSFAIGLSTLQHFPAVQALMKDSDLQKFCATGAVMAKNQYGYDLLLITLEMKMKSGVDRVLPLLLQMASIQAFEGPGVKRLWIGFDRRDLSSIVRKMVAEARERGRIAQIEDPIGFGLAPLELAKSVLPIQKVVAGTLGFVHVPDVEAGWETYVVSQLRVIGTIANPSSAQYLLDSVAVQIQERTHRARILPLPNFFAAYQNLWAAQAMSQPREISRESFIQKLQSLSEIPRLIPLN